MSYEPNRVSGDDIEMEVGGYVPPGREPQEDASIRADFPGEDEPADIIQEEGEGDLLDLDEEAEDDAEAAFDERYGDVEFAKAPTDAEMADEIAGKPTDQFARNDEATAKLSEYMADPANRSAQARYEAEVEAESRAADPRLKTIPPAAVRNLARRMRRQGLI